ncbi:MAG: hypothetical protein HY951_16500 [Bacteroidia bacterium]|nr:hypothetical protein [Bacteroidia bacterium]
MKIIYQFLDLDPGSQFLTVFSTVMSVVTFVGILAWVFMLKKSYTNEMSQLPLEKENIE